MADNVLVTQSGGIVELRLNRPEKKNALTVAMYDALSAALVDGNGRSDVRVFVISAEGDAFCSGNDIGDFLRSNGVPTDSAPERFLHALIDSAKPVVAAVQGLGVGIGMTMLLHCDLVYAAPQAKLSVPFVAMGLVPEAGSSMILPQLLGRQGAARLLLLGESLSADAARDAGLVCEIVPAETLRAYALAKAAVLAAAPPAALASARALMRGDRGAFDAQRSRELEAFGRALRGPEAREALTAFMEKRGPNFSSSATAV